jgi:hypothetical protein
MISIHEPAPAPPTAPTLTNPVDLPFDAIAGMSIRLEPWHSVNGQLFIGLTFTSALDERAHDLTPEQALALRDALTRLAEQ